MAWYIAIIPKLNQIIQLASSDDEPVHNAEVVVGLLLPDDPQHCRNNRELQGRRCRNFDAIVVVELAVVGIVVFVLALDALTV